MSVWGVALFAVFGAAAGHLLDLLAVHETAARTGFPSSPSRAQPTQPEEIGCNDLVPPRLKRGRYPISVVCTAVLFILVGLRFGSPAPGLWAAPAFCYLAAIAVALTTIDLRTRTIPDRVVLPSYPIAAALLALASWGLDDWGALGRAGIGAVVLAAAYLTLALVYPSGMGTGDVKLAGLLGLYLGWVGWGALVVGALTPFLLGAAFGVVLLVSGRAGRGSEFAFGPWMLLGAAAGIAVGERLWAVHLR